MLNAAGVWGGGGGGRPVMSLLTVGPGQSHAGGPGIFGFYFQKAIDWLIIYSFFS